MKRPTDSVPCFAGDFMSATDERLVSYIEELHVAVRAMCVGEQLAGASLAAIVAKARALVTAADETAKLAKTFPPTASPAIMRQALAWCVEEYRPPSQPRFTTRLTHE